MNLFTNKIRMNCLVSNEPNESDEFVSSSPNALVPITFRYNEIKSIRMEYI